MIRIERIDERVEFRIGATAVAGYGDGADEPAHESPRPFLHPIRTPGGVVVSDVRPPDHDWHWGLSLAVANIAVPGEPDGVNLWGGVTYTADRGYLQLDNNGTQARQSIEVIDGEVRERLRWRTGSGRPFLAESRTMTPRPVAEHPGMWRLDIASQWTNSLDEVVRFGSPTTAGRGNAGYGGLFLRAAPLFQDAVVLGPSGVLDETDAMGATAPWLALATDAATVVMAAATSNPVALAPWFVRTATPMLCAAPFFFSEWALDANATASWGWTFLVADGRLDAGQIATALAA